MKKKINKVGNSLSFRIPQRMADSLGWNEKDDIDIEIFNGSVVLKKSDEPFIKKQDIIATMAASINYLIYAKDDLPQEIERQLLETIRFGSSVLLNEDNDLLEEQCLKTIQLATNYFLENN